MEELEYNYIFVFSVAYVEYSIRIQVFRFTEANERVTKFYVKLVLRTIIRYIVNKFDSPGSYNSQDIGVRTDAESANVDLFCLF